MLRKQIFKNFKLNDTTPNVLVVSFLIHIIFSRGWKNFDRCVIHMFHLFGYIDLSVKPSEYFNKIKLVQIYQEHYPQKIKKEELRGMFKLSNNSFNKKFKNYLIEKGLINKKKYELVEAYELICYWFGEGSWGRLEGYSKQELANMLTNGNIKQLGVEFILYFENNEKKYKNNDIIAPRDVRGFFNHLGYTKEELKEFKII